MTDAPVFTLRPVEEKPSDTLTGAFRVHLHPEDAKLLQLETGDLCQIQILNGSSSTAAVGISWRSGNARRIVKTSHYFKNAFGFRLGDKLSVSKYANHLRTIGTIHIREVSSAGLSATTIPLAKLRFSIACALHALEAVWPGGYFDVSPNVHGRKTRKRSFTIDKIDAETAAAPNVTAPYLFEGGSVIEIVDDSLNSPSTERESYEDVEDPAELDSTGIGGLDAQLELINEEIRSIRRLPDGSEKRLVTRYPQLQTSGHVLLNGAPGTGKTLVIDKAKACFRNRFSIGETPEHHKVEEAVSRVFAQAVASQPSLITIDNLHLIAPKTGRELTSNSLANIFKREISKLGQSRVLVLAATQNPNDVDLSLRSSFSLDLELPIPDALARVHILRSIFHPENRTADDALLNIIGERTHGFVGKDLSHLSCTAFKHARKRLRSAEQNARDDATKMLSTEQSALEKNEVHYCNDQENVLLRDFEAAFCTVRPSAMREVFLETPKVHWEDIGGSETVKEALRRAVEKPFKRPDIMARYDNRPPRGILLYGPPGCSKTLTAKAVATSSGLNFIAVKGAELTSMYVGETERAVREVFRKARAASPSVIFFDEIDAIAASRGGEDGKAGGGIPGLNVLTTLLNEMDGIESLNSVLVLGATNRPETLDSALLRPGRFDSIVYVPPPSTSARKVIFEINTRRKPLSNDVDLDLLATQTEGYSGADVVEVCNRAGWIASERAEKEEENNTGPLEHQEDGVRMGDFQDALKKIGSSITAEMVQQYDRWATSRDGVRPL